jgi:glycosyltransferase involved in cell wall biosynthesis
MRIGQIITQYPYPDQFDSADGYFCSGAERVARNVSVELAESGADIHVFTSSHSARYTCTDQNDVTVHRSPSIDSIGTTEIAPTLPLAPVIRQSPTLDLIHAHNSTPPGIIAAYVSSKATDTPLVITHHGGENYASVGSWSRRFGLRAYTNHIMQTVFDHADAITVPSPGYVDESAVLSETKSEVHVIPNGISRNAVAVDASETEAKRALGIDPSEFVYLFMSPHHPRKGPDVLVNAFLELHEQNPETRLVLAGTGDLSPELRKQAETHPNGSAVDFPGFVSERKKATYMKAAGVFVLPSPTPASEVFPLSLLEAAAQGTPTIASDFPALRSILSTHDAGLLFEPDDGTALQEAMERLYSDDALRRQCSNNARALAYHHSWQQIARQYRELYATLVG